MHVEEINKLQALKSLYEAFKTELQKTGLDVLYLEGCISGVDAAIAELQQMDKEEDARQYANFLREN